MIKVKLSQFFINVFKILFVRISMLAIKIIVYVSTFRFHIIVAFRNLHFYFSSFIYYFPHKLYCLQVANNNIEKTLCSNHARSNYN